MTPEQQKAMAMANARRRQAQQNYDPTEGMSGTDRFLAGMGKAFVDAYTGGKQLYTGAFGSEEEQQALQQEIDERKRLDQPLMNTGAGFAGNIAGNVAAYAPTAFIPGAGTYKGATAIGAGIGALAPTSSGEDRSTNIATGAVGGAAGRAIAGGVGRALSPKSSPEVQTLMREGVTPPPGQTLGGSFAKTEEAATSIPFVGEAIKGAQTRSIEDFNKAVFNRVLAPLGRQATKIGREGLEEADDVIKSAYDDALTGMTIRVDNQFVDDLANVGQQARDLLPDAGKKLQQVIASKIMPRIGRNREVSGEAFKTLDSELGAFSRKYLGSQDPEVVELGRVVEGIKNALRQTVERQATGDKADLLRAANNAFMRKLRVENAVGRTGAEGGIFTPKQFKSAIRAMDSSARKGQFARGQAPMQDLAEAGEAVLSQRVPDSGTPLRTMTGAGLLGGAAYVDPMAAAGAAGLAGMYTRPMQSAVAKILTQRPEAVAKLGRGVQRLSPMAAALSSPVTASERE